MIEQEYNQQSINNKSNLKRASSGIFLILCTFPILAIMAVMPTYIYAIFSTIFNFSDEISSVLSYIFTFALPQILYPLFTMAAAFFMISFSGKRGKDIISVNDAPASEILLAVGIFLGMGTVGTYISDFITQLIIKLGAPVPDISELLSAPQDPWQFCLYIISIAVMPSICEEVIFRGIICGILKDYNKTAAIIFSSIAFSLVHSTVQQIPFSFMMGLFLSYLFIKYNSILPCILLHFINNFISCFFMILYENMSEEAYISIVQIYDISTILIGILCTLFFIISIKKKHSTEKEIFAVSGKEFTINVVFSIPFILFVLIYLFQTVTGILSNYFS